MKKRILSMLLAIAMVCSLLPTVAFAAETTYDLWVGGVQVTSANKDNIVVPDATGTATYDHDSKTLTLDNFSYEGQGYVYDYPWCAAIFSKNDLTVKVVGSNTVTASVTGDYTAEALNVGGALTITGDSGSTLTLTGAGRKGVDCGGNLKIEDVTVNATGLSGLCSWEGNITIDNATVYATATGSGIYEGAIIALKKNITIENSKVTATASSGNAISIESGDLISNTCTIKNSEVTISNAKCGMRLATYANLKVENSTLTITAIEKAIDAYGANDILVDNHVVYAGETAPGELVTSPTTSTYNSKYVKIVPVLPHDHCVCGASHVAIGTHTTEENPTWVAISREEDFTKNKESGYYYLTDDIEVSAKWEFTKSRDIVLCLNGHDITYTGTGNASFIPGSTALNFTLTDCHAEAGSISGFKNTYGGAINVKKTFTMYNGKIAGNTASQGGGVYVDQNATFYMYGGEISGNTASSIGGGVYIKGSMEVAGAPVVNNNENSNTGTSYQNKMSAFTKNIYSSNDAVVVGTGGLTAGAKLDVTPKFPVSESTTPDAVVTIAKGCTSDLSSYFTYTSKHEYTTQYDEAKSEVQLKYVAPPAPKVVVTFDMNGHGEQIPPQTIDEGTCATRPENPTADGYLFIDWEDDYGSWNFGWEIWFNTTLCAKWKLNSPTISGVEGYTADYDGASHEISVTVASVSNLSYSYQWYKDGKAEENEIDDATSSTYSVKNAADSGTYYCKVTVSDGSSTNSVWSDAVTVAIDKASVAVPVISSKAYTGNTLTADITDTAVYTVTTNNGGVAVGNYEVVLTLKDSANYKWADSNDEAKTLAFAITKAGTNTITGLSIANWTYGETPNAPTAASTFGTPAFTYVGTGSTVYVESATVPTNAGTYKVIAKVADTESHVGASAEAEFEIAKANPSYTVPTGLTATYGNTLADVDLPDGWTWKDAATTEVGNVGDNNFDVIYTHPDDTANDTENYNQVEGSVTIKVSPKVVNATVTVDGDSFIFNGSEQKPGVTVKDGENAIPENEYTVTYTDNTNVGTATVTITDKDGGNYTVSGTTTFEISKKASAALSGVEREFMRTIATTGNEIDVAAMLPDNRGTTTYTVTSSGYTVLENVAVDTNGKLVFDTKTSAAAASDTITVKVVMQNYTDVTLTVTVILNEKTPQEITGVTAETGLIYNGETQKGYTGTPASEKYTGAYEITYTGRSNTYNSSAAPVNAGDYTVTFKIPDSDLYYSGNISINFTIGKTQATVTADDKEAYVGSRMPELTYKVSGLIGDDTISVELSCDSNMNRAGETPIVVTATDPNGNYEVTTVNGTLTVKYYPYIPQPTYDVEIADNITNGEVSISKKVAFKGDTITITVAPDASYELTGLTVSDSRSNAIAVTKISDGKYTFKMPGYDVEIDAVFTMIDTACPGENTCPMYGYTDLDMTAWYHDGVHFCIANDLMTGTASDTFAPGMTTSRAMIVTILWRLEGKPVVNYAMSFEDVAADTWYTEAIRWAASEKIMEGYGNGMFGTNDAITREQMATIMYRYAKYKGYDVSVGENTNILSYGDAFDVAEWAIPAMQWACGSGMIQGIADGSTMNLAPQGNATRAQAAAILQRYCENVAKGD